MYISSVRIKNFQCVGDESLEINLTSEITAFVGANGTGKTAVLIALQRLFGVTNRQRRVTISDFHIPSDKKLENFRELKLQIEADIVFPELDVDDESETPVPAFFKRMHVSGEGIPPICTIRLDAEWQEDSTSEGAIEQELNWVVSENEDGLLKVSAADRGLIQVHYIPATRNASQLLEQQTALMKKRLFRAVEWTEGLKDLLETAATDIGEKLEKQKAIRGINEVLGKNWNELSCSKVLANPKVSVISSDLKDFVNRLNIILSPSDDGGVRSIDELSDGLTSLFYFALTASVFDIEQKVANACALEEESGFCHASLDRPELTLFAVEEPENHLAPFYLSRILRLISSVAKNSEAQAIVTSHASSILGRVEPDTVRHFRLDGVSRTSIVKEITFPTDDGDASKFMRQAVLAYPELYFAKCVVLCEGDSEQIVIPKLAQAMGIDLDPSFVAVVPLGGRHVNHFWKLLNDLAIPFVTLIDLDLGRATGGWSRLATISRQLIEFGTSPKAILTTSENKVLSPDDFDKWNSNIPCEVKTIKGWADGLTKEFVFFSWPIDLDMSMLNSFTEKYTDYEATKGPRLSADKAAKPVLKKNRNEAWYDGGLSGYKELFPHYNYLFLGKSKPVSHFKALSEIDDKELRDNAPEELKRLILCVKTMLDNNEV